MRINENENEKWKITKQFLRVHFRSVNYHHGIKNFYECLNQIAQTAKLQVLIATTTTRKKILNQNRGTYDIHA